MKLKAFSAFCLAAVMLSCGNKEVAPSQGGQEPGTDPTPEAAGVITLATNEGVSFTAAGGTAEISFSATKSWTAAVSAQWLSVSPKSGEAGETLMTVTAGTNRSQDPLMATVTLTCDKDVKMVTVTQEPAKPSAIKLSDYKDVLFPETGGSAEVSFSAKEAWTASVDAAWLSVTPTSGAIGENCSVTVTAQANATTGRLTGHLTLSSETDMQSLTFIVSEPVELPDDPVQPEGPIVWPTDENALDYGLADGESRQIKLIGSQFNEAGVYNDPQNPSLRNITAPCVVDNVTYMGPGLIYYGNRIAMNKVASEWDENYADQAVPASHCISFKINRPGTIHFYPAIVSNDGGVLRVPTYYLSLVTKKGGVVSGKRLREFVPDEADMADGNDSANRTDANIRSADWAHYWVSLSVTEKDLKGIDEAATVYLYHRNQKVNTLTVQYWPFIWQSGDVDVPAGQPKFLLAGDSTCSEYSAASAPQTGWGQVLAESLGGKVIVQNYAVGGESTKSFIDSGKWDSLRSSIVDGDIVLIQFGHNDEKTDEAHATDPYTTYQANLTKMINETLEKGGKPVLLTSICRLYFRSNGEPQRTHGEYPAAMKALAQSTNTPCIDMEELTWQWLKGLGESGSTPYFVLDKRGNTSNPDRSHLTEEGAKVVAGMIVDGLKELGLWQ